MIYWVAVAAAVAALAVASCGPSSYMWLWWSRRTKHQWHQRSLENTVAECCWCAVVVQSLWVLQVNLACCSIPGHSSLPDRGALSEGGKQRNMWKTAPGRLWKQGGLKLTGLIQGPWCMDQRILGMGCGGESQFAFRLETMDLHCRDGYRRPSMSSRLMLVCCEAFRHGATAFLELARSHCSRYLPRGMLLGDAKSTVLFFALSACHVTASQLPEMRLALFLGGTLA